MSIHVTSRKNIFEWIYSDKLKMTKVEDFGEHLFPILADKLIREENSNSSEEKPDISEDKLDISEEKPDISEKNHGSAAENLKYLDLNDVISCSVLMLSYAYRSAFRERFNEVLPILKRAKGNPMIYIGCFAKVLHEKYSPLKFLIVCSFISEIFLFFSLRQVSKKKHRYVKRTTKALKNVFQCVFEEDFPQNGWYDIQNEASKIAKGFPFLEPFIDNETSGFTASEVAVKMINTKYDDENQEAAGAVAGTPQEMVGVNIPSDPNSQVWVNIPAIEVPILDADGLPTNQTAYLVNSENPMCPPALALSFGTVDQDAQLSHLLQFSGYQTEAVTFQDQPSGMEPNVQKVVGNTEPSNIESQAVENLIAKNSVDGTEPSSRTVKLTENAKSKPCAEDNGIASEQPDDDEFRKDFLASEFEDESGPSIQTDKKTEMESGRSISDNEFIPEQESKDSEKHDSISEPLSKKNDCESSKEGNIYDPERETFSKENVNDPDSETFSKEDSYEGNSTESELPSTVENDSDPERGLPSTEENDSDPERGLPSTEENDSDTERDLLSTEENVSDPERELPSTKDNVSDTESELPSTEENVSDSESGPFFKEDALASESAVNVLENQSAIL